MERVPYRGKYRGKYQGKYLGTLGVEKKELSVVTELGRIPLARMPDLRGLQQPIAIRSKTNPFRSSLNRQVESSIPSAPTMITNNILLRSCDRYFTFTFTLVFDVRTVPLKDVFT
jgi:hypothetical protein